jgi:hypothetical protein
MTNMFRGMYVGFGESLKDLQDSVDIDGSPDRLLLEGPSNRATGLFGKCTGLVGCFRTFSVLAVVYPRCANARAQIAVAPALRHLPLEG